MKKKILADFQICISVPLKQINALSKKLFTEYDRYVINQYEEFVNCPQKLLKGIICVYLSVEKDFPELEEIQEGLYNINMQILLVHMAKWVLIKQQYA